MILEHYSIIQYINVLGMKGGRRDSSGLRVIISQVRHLMEEGTSWETSIDYSIGQEFQHTNQGSCNVH